MPSLNTLIDLPPFQSAGKWEQDHTYTLAKHCENIDLKTIQHIDELVTERHTNNSTREKEYITGDFCIYYLDNNLPKLAITRITHNPLFQPETIDTLFEHFTFMSGWHGLKITPETFTNALADIQTTIINLTKIRAVGQK